MSVIDVASQKSIWRGIEYYKEKKVTSYFKNEDGTYGGKVSGSGKVNYDVHFDKEHPRKSTCNCPLAKGTKIICKHIIAVSLCVDNSELDRFLNEKTIYKSEVEARKAEKYKQYMRYAKLLSKAELCEAYAEAMLELDECKLNNQKY